MLKIISAKYLMALNSTLALTKPNLIDGMNKIFKDIGGARLSGTHQMNFAGPVSRTVQCPSCSSMAEIKLTKTNHLMLRCDFCKIIDICQWSIVTSLANKSFLLVFFIML